MGVILFNEKLSSDYGIHVEKPPVYAIPERDYEVVHIPGRNGDLVIDNGSYKNTVRTYNISFGEMDGDYTYMASRIAEWLHSASGYARLEDSYEPDYYRLAYYMAENEMENLYHQAGRLTIEFNCKPARFYKSGEQAIRFTSAQTLLNPSIQSSFPQLTIVASGSGTVTINGQTITIQDISSKTSIVIDSELQDVYDAEAQTNLNNKVSFSGGSFPVLAAGLNSIRFTGSVTSVEVIPRWWTL